MFSGPACLSGTARAPLRFHWSLTMRLASYYLHGAIRLGALANGHMVDLERAYQLLRERSGSRHPPTSLPSEGRAFLEGGPDLLPAAEDAVACALEMLNEEGAEALAGIGVAYAESTVRLKPAVLEPRKIICLGINYRDHAAEAGRDLPRVPQLFAKYSNTLIGPRDPIPLPRVSDQVDIEAELAFVIGCPGRYIPIDRAMEHVAGYAAFNDVSVRDFQHMTSQFTAGKIMDGSGPMGPLVTADEVPDPHRLRVRSWIDNLPMQDSNTSEMRFGVAEIVAFISQLTTLEPGDIVATGTPGGVGARRTPPVFLRPGQTVIVDIEGLGRLENPVQLEDTCPHMQPGGGSRGRRSPASSPNR